MKRAPDAKKLEETLRASSLSSSGFLGTDRRSLEEILAADARVVAETGYTCQEIASRMRTVTELAKKGLGTSVEIGTGLEACVTEARGRLVCPWPHPGTFDKTVTEARRKGMVDVLRWSDLNTHMIAEHGFFEGAGSPFRLDPKQLVAVIFG